jgi:hypothetical protein
MAQPGRGKGRVAAADPMSHSTSSESAASTVIQSSDKRAKAIAEPGGTTKSFGSLTLVLGSVRSLAVMSRPFRRVLERAAPRNGMQDRSRLFQERLRGVKAPLRAAHTVAAPSRGGFLRRRRQVWFWTDTGISHLSPAVTFPSEPLGFESLVSTWDISRHSAEGGQGRNLAIWPEVVRVLAADLYVNYIVYRCMYKVPRAWRRVVAKVGRRSARRIIKRSPVMDVAIPGRRSRWLRQLGDPSSRRSPASEFLRLVSASPDAYHTKYAFRIDPALNLRRGRTRIHILRASFPNSGCPHASSGPTFRSTALDLDSLQQ